MRARANSSDQLQMLRAQNCGTRCSTAASGPRLVTVTRISVSSGAAFAYSTVTSK